MEKIRAFLAKKYAKWIIIAGAVLLVVAIGLGIWFAIAGETFGDEDDEPNRNKVVQNDNEEEEEEIEEIEELSVEDAEYDFEVNYRVISNVDANVTMYSDEAQESVPAGRYQPIAGGVYVDDEEIPIGINLHRVELGESYPGLTYIGGSNPANWAGEILPNYGVTIEEGLKLTLYGVYQSSDTGVTFKTNRLEMQFDGEKWIQTSELPESGNENQADASYDVVLDDFTVYGSGDTAILLSAKAAASVPEGHYIPVTGGIYITGATQSPITMPLIRSNVLEGLFYISNSAANFSGQSLANYGVTVAQGLKMKIDGVYTCESTGVAFKVSNLEMKYDGEKWVITGGVKTTQPSQSNQQQGNSGNQNITYDVVLDDFTVYGSGDTAILLSAKAAASVPEGHYIPVTGGIYITGATQSPITMPLIRSNVLEGLFYISNSAANFSGQSLANYGVTVAQGLKMKIDGVYTCESTGVAFKVSNLEMEYDGEKWVIKGGSQSNQPGDSDNQQQGNSGNQNITYDVVLDDFTVYGGDSTAMLLSAKAAASVPEGDYTPVTGGIYIEGATESPITMPLLRRDHVSGLFYISNSATNFSGQSLANYGVTVTRGLVMKIDGVYTCESTGVAFKVSNLEMEFDGEQWVIQKESESPVADFVADYRSRYATDPNYAPDKNINLLSSFVEENISQTAWFSPIEGGIYVNGTGEALKVPLQRVVVSGYPGLSYFYSGSSNTGNNLEDYGIDVTEGLQLTVDGFYSDGTTVFEIQNLQLVYLEGKWGSYDAVMDVTPYEQSVVTAELRFNEAFPEQFVNALYQDYQVAERMNGGIYLNDSTTGANKHFHHIGYNLFYITEPDVLSIVGVSNAASIPTGTKLKINAVCDNHVGGGYAVWIRGTVTWDGSQWSAAE